MAANEDPKGIRGAKKPGKVAAEASVKPAAPRGRPRKALPSTISAEASKPALATAAAAQKPGEKPASAKTDVEAQPAIAPAKPVQSKPIQPKPAEFKPVAAQPAPASAKPAESIPSEAKPMDEPTPAAATPADEPKPAELPPVVSAVAPAEAVANETATALVEAADAAAEAVSPSTPAESTPAEPAPPATFAFAGMFTPFMLEDKMMEMSPNFSGFQDAMTEAQAKAKAAFDKSSSMLGEVSDFTKGNVEAIMESGKILAEGMQGLGSEIVSESRSAFETMTGDIKELAGAKSPTDFFKVQGEMMRKNFDSAVAYGSKNSEAMLKLMSDAMAPISGRLSIAMDKARSVSV